MAYLLILMLFIINPPQIVIVYETSRFNNEITYTLEETFAYKQCCFAHELRAPQLFPGFTSTIHDIKANKTSMVTKRFQNLIIHHFDESPAELIKKYEVADYSISYDKNDKKTILGYEPYKAVIKDRTNNKTIVAYISENITETRFIDLQFKYPLLKGLPLSYEDHKSSSIAIGVSKDVDDSIFEYNEKDASRVLDEEGLKKLIPEATGGRTLKQVEEYLKSRSKE